MELKIDTKAENNKSAVVLVVSSEGPLVISFQKEFPIIS